MPLAPPLPVLRSQALSRRAHTDRVSLHVPWLFSRSAAHPFASDPRTDAPLGLDAPRHRHGRAVDSAWPLTFLPLKTSRSSAQIRPSRSTKVLTIRLSRGVAVQSLPNVTELWCDGAAAEDLLPTPRSLVSRAIRVVGYESHTCINTFLERLEIRAAWGRSWGSARRKRSRGTPRSRSLLTAPSAAEDGLYNDRMFP